MEAVGGLPAITFRDVGLRPVPSGPAANLSRSDSFAKPTADVAWDALLGIVPRQRDILGCPVEQPGEFLT